MTKLIVDDGCFWESDPEDPMIAKGISSVTILLNHYSSKFKQKSLPNIFFCSLEKLNEISIDSIKIQYFNSVITSIVKQFYDAIVTVL